MTSWIPPLFSKFGQSLKDLLTKQYDYKNHELRVKSQVEPRLTIESAATVGEANAIGGSSKLKFKPPTFGEVEAEVNTNGNSSATVKHTKLYDGLTVILKGDHKPNEAKPTKQAAANLAAEYRRNAFAGTASVNVAKPGEYQTEMTAVTGFDGFSVGGQAVYGITKRDFVDYNVAMEYTPNPVYTLTVKTLDKMDKASIGYVHTMKREKLATQVGAQFDFTRDGSRELAFGVDHAFDDKTKGKAKWNTNYILAAVLEHRLANPAFTAQFAAEWNMKAQPAPTKFGVGLTFE